MKFELYNSREEALKSGLDEARFCHDFCDVQNFIDDTYKDLREDGFYEEAEIAKKTAIRTALHTSYIEARDVVRDISYERNTWEDQGGPLGDSGYLPRVEEIARKNFRATKLEASKVAKLAGLDTKKFVLDKFDKFLEDGE